MKKRMIILVLMFIFAWTFPLTHDVQVKVNIGKSLPKKEVRTQATWKEKQYNKSMAMEYAKAGWDWDKRQRDCVYRLFMKESRFDHLADNPRSTAFGIGQVLKETSREPEIQILKAYKYIKHRYSTPCQALAHHLRKNWY
jgi:hypothetical protein